MSDLKIGQVQSCKNCSAAFKKSSEDVYCRARPPVPIMVGQGQNLVSQQLQPVINSYFPIMMNEGWCREWQENKTINTTTTKVE